MPLVIATNFLSTWCKASCVWLKRPLLPGREITMAQISPITLCHFSTPINFWMQGIPSRISLEQFCRCGGKDSVMLIMLMTYPNKTLQVDHFQSPSNKILSRSTSFWVVGLLASCGQNTFSRVWNNVFHNWRRCLAGSWASPGKLWMKMSM